MSKKDDGLYLWDMKEIEKMIHHQRTHEVIEEYTFKEIEEGLERGKDLP
jgi:hypothetical protein